MEQNPFHLQPSRAPRRDQNHRRRLSGPGFPGALPGRGGRLSESGNPVRLFGGVLHRTRGDQHRGRQRGKCDRTQQPARHRKIPQPPSRRRFSAKGPVRPLGGKHRGSGDDGGLSPPVDGADGPHRRREHPTGGNPGATRPKTAAAGLFGSDAAGPVSDAARHVPGRQTRTEPDPASEGVPAGTAKAL